MSSLDEKMKSFVAAEALPHILVVDDDERLRNLLSRFLQERDFLVTTAIDAMEARAKLACMNYDLIVLDVMMPGENGIELTSSLRDKGINTPVLLLTALQEVESRIEGFEAGADDYLPKPFEPRELLLRINAILRRVVAIPSSSGNNYEICFGKWTLDMERAELVSEDGRQSLTQAEQVLLKAMIDRKGEVINREELARLCGLDAVERTIDVQITRLRKKVEEDSKMPRYIQTVRGRGYVLRPD